MYTKAPKIKFYNKLCVEYLQSQEKTQLELEKKY